MKQTQEKKQKQKDPDWRLFCVCHSFDVRFFCQESICRLCNPLDTRGSLVGIPVQENQARTLEL